MMEIPCQVPKSQHPVSTEDLSSPASSCHPSSHSFIPLKTFKDRLADIPIYAKNEEKLLTMYTNAKQGSRVLDGVMQGVEGAVRSYLPYDRIKSLDEKAAEWLAKVTERFSILHQSPSYIGSIARSSLADTTQLCVEKVQKSKVFEVVTTGLDGTFALCEIAVEKCLPPDLQDAEAMMGSEENTHGSSFENAEILAKRIVARGGRHIKLCCQIVLGKFSSQPVDNQFNEPDVSKDKVINDNEGGMQTFLESRRARNWERVYRSKSLIVDEFDRTYTNATFLPSKVLTLTGEVYISAKEMTYAYVNSRSLLEIHLGVLEAFLRDQGLTSDELSHHLLQLKVDPLNAVRGLLDVSSLQEWLSGIYASSRENLITPVDRSYGREPFLEEVPRSRLVSWYPVHLD